MGKTHIPLRVQSLKILENNLHFRESDTPLCVDGGYVLVGIDAFVKLGLGGSFETLRNRSPHILFESGWGSSSSTSSGGLTFFDNV